MAVIGISLIVASVLWVLVRPPPWLATFLLPWRDRRGIGKPPATRRPSGTRDDAGDSGDSGIGLEGPSPLPGSADQPAVWVQAEEARRESREPTPSIQLLEEDAPAPIPVPPTPAAEKAVQDRLAMPPPPPLMIRRQRPDLDADSGEQTTPKATAAQPSTAVPSFSLETEPTINAPTINTPTLNAPSPSVAPLNAPSLRPPVPAFPQLLLTPSPSSSLPPPPCPLTEPFRSVLLAPPPTHTTKPAKPSRKVLLAPGHSPLDWASISGPNADLRNLPPETPYLRVSPAMLKRQTGRKGKDAWTVLGGRVYNITPYAPYHPGGVPELMRCAGRDGSKLFGEVHPWVNYENMLQACLVGIFVDNHEEPSKMEEMD
ncbi:hypothetical protein jhhlp_004533 [Lomentospora prolificans]|uniref:Cytochrome b5 heme-binding domain-containing protein n=1 Tax=Lomentospora prolificans TaxID=41688 RepID=A0A2N3NBU3_9PEZI|nr:hypothetical protein jhhlp_004533 [Lomentospora prolificans]